MKDNIIPNERLIRKRVARDLRKPLSQLIEEQMAVSKKRNEETLKRLDDLNKRFEEALKKETETDKRTEDFLKRQNDLKQRGND